MAAHEAMANPGTALPAPGGAAASASARLTDTVLGLAASVAGVTTSYYADTPSGGTIVLVSIAGFVVLSAVAALRRRRPAASTSASGAAAG